MNSNLILIYFVFYYASQFTGIVAGASVTLYGENYVIRGEFMSLNCTADVSPTDRTALFLIENESYASLRKTKNGCFNSRNLCLSKMCSCSEDGRSFFLRMKHEKQTIKDKYHVTCLMKFGGEKISDTMKVDVIDLPIFSMEVAGNCTGSSNFTIHCKYSNSLHKHGFSPLVHLSNSIVIRNITGNVQDNMSTFQIDNCSREDSGTYVCSGWSNVFGRVIKANKTTSIPYEDSPIINTTSILKLSTTITVFSAKFYTISGTMSSYWYKDKDRINTTTSYVVVIEECIIDLIVYGKAVTHPGYISNLTIKDNTPGQYTLVLQNTYGETRVMFNIPHVSVVLTIVLMGYRNKYYASVSFTKSLPRRAIYYAAPPVNNPAHTYSTPEPHNVEAEFDVTIGTGHQYEEINDTDKDVHIYETSHQYIELN